MRGFSSRAEKNRGRARAKSTDHGSSDLLESAARVLHSRTSIGPWTVRKNKIDRLDTPCHGAPGDFKQRGRREVRRCTTASPRQPEQYPGDLHQKARRGGQQGLAMIYMLIPSHCGRYVSQGMVARRESLVAASGAGKWRTTG